jgi:predicted Zn-dependent protease
MQRSPADETEIVWLETCGGRAENRHREVEARPHSDRTIMVRVIDRRRVGSHRTGAASVGELNDAIRLAIAQSRSRDPLQGMLHLPVDETPLEVQSKLWDPRIAALDPARLKTIYQPWITQRGITRLRWAAGRVTVFNSRGVRRQSEVTAADIEARIGRRPGGGRAASAARSLDALMGQVVVDRARDRHARGPVEEVPASPLPIVLSPEAACELCDILNRVAFSAVAYYHGSSFLREHLDVQVFDRALNLYDDGTDLSGLPFPFDLEGTAKSRVDLIHKGTPKTPALDQRQAAQLGLTPTAHAIGGNDARASNLFLSGDELAEQDLLQAADGGLWIGWLDQVECFEPGRVQIRAHASGVRRIVDGALAGGVPDLIWEDSLLRALSNLLGIGKSRMVRISHDGFLGGIAAPSIAIGAVGGLRLADS